MTVVVTGASGHIGATLTRALLADGRRVRALVHDEAAGLDGLDVERVQGDVRDPASLRRAFAGADVVYHLAARITLVTSDADEVFAINVDGPRNVCEAALNAGVRRLVHFSSIHAFDDCPRDVPMDEKRPPAHGPGFPVYDRSKAAGQDHVLEAVSRGLDAVIVNPSGVVGPGDYRMSAMGQVFLDLWHGRMPALVEGGFNWVDVRDVVQSAMAAETRGRTGERYLLPGHWVSVRDVARTVTEVTGRRTPRLVTPMWLARASVPFIAAFSAVLRRKPLYTAASLRALRQNRVVLGAKAAEELGHAPRPFSESVRDVYEWFEKAGYLQPGRKALPAPPSGSRQVGE